MNREVGLSRTVVSQIVKDFGGESLHRVKVLLISEEGCGTQATRAAGLVNDLKAAGRAKNIILFSDENNFVVNPVRNA